jgi:hypothetical protein
LKGGHFGQGSKNTCNKQPDIFYRVKITGVKYEHTCQLSTVFHWESKQKKGTLQPDLNGLSNIIGLLQEKPNLKPDLLRPFLLKYIPGKVDGGGGMDF